MDLSEQLNRVFYPKTVAVIGASDNMEKVGAWSVQNLLNGGYKGKIFPVNPSLSEVFSLKSYPSVTAIPEEVDLAIIAVPVQHILTVIEDCVAKGIKAVIMFTSGFGELGTKSGQDLQDKIRNIANKAGIKIIGPNCLGVLNTHINFNGTFQSQISSTKAGNTALISQSGGVCVYLAQTLTEANVGVSKLISMGNRCNLDFHEVLSYFTQDEDTKVIVLYIEGLEKPRELMTVAKQTVKQKPIIAYKAGRHEKVNQASLSHTGALSGNYDYYKAAFTQSGIIAIDSLTELLDTTKALSYQPPAAGNRVAIVAIAAGVGLIMADKCYEAGLRLAEFSPETQQKLKKLVSPIGSYHNPVDMGLLFNNVNLLREVIKALIEDDNVDMISISGIPWYIQIVNQALESIPNHNGKPVVHASFYSRNEEDILAKERLENINHIPNFYFPERAVTALSALHKYGEILRTRS
ncbi:MAG: CoA-binding protein [Dehalococcoidales bacterium]|nr:CoA-binding protein [Dehalococcoidales bacterium]